MCGGWNASPHRPPADKPGQQNREQAGNKYAVESAGAADRCDGRPEALQLTQIEEIGPDQDADAAPGIGERRSVSPGDKRGGDCRGQRWQNRGPLQKPGLTERSTRESRELSKDRP